MGRNFDQVTDAVAEWVHVAIVVHGINETDSFIVYHNGVAEATSRPNDTEYVGVFEPMIKLGRANGDEVAVDELIIWFRQLDSLEIVYLSDASLLAGPIWYSQNRNK